MIKFEDVRCWEQYADMVSIESALRRTPMTENTDNPYGTSDNEIDALIVAFDALSPLTPEAKLRVLTWLSERFKAELKEAQRGA